MAIAVTDHFYGNFMGLPTLTAINFQKLSHNQAGAMPTATWQRCTGTYAMGMGKRRFM
jgi:hypothetical protein